MKPDPLADVAEEFSAEEQRRKCKHPHLHFESYGKSLRCIDCKRYWLAGWVDPRGMETMMTDFTYMNPEIQDSEFRHTPNEVSRQEPTKIR